MAPRSRRMDRHPVAFSHALEECRYVEAHVVEVESERVVVARQLVAYDHLVAGIVDSAGAFVDLVVAVAVDEFNVARTQFIVALCLGVVYALVDSLVVDARLVFGGFLVGSEQTGYPVAPYVAELLANVVVADEFVGVVELGDFGRVVAEGRRNAVGELMAEEAHVVFPAYIKFISACAQVGAVFLRCRGAEHRGERH